MSASLETVEGEEKSVKAPSRRWSAAKQTRALAVSSTQKWLKIDNADDGTERSDRGNNEEDGDGLGAGGGDGDYPKGISGGRGGCRGCNCKGGDPG